MLNVRITRTARAATALAFGAALALAGVAQASAASASSTTTTTPAASHAAYKAECAAHVAGHMHCDAFVRTDVKRHVQAHGVHAAASSVSGFGPSDLQSAYNLAGAAAANGSGETVAIVDAFNDPTAASDLATYRSQYGLASCTTSNGCLKIVGQTGSTSSLPSDDTSSDDWSGEVSLDLDMVSATCPLCNIDLVEASSDSDSDLGTAVNEAVSLGAKYISNSYGGSESSAETGEDTSYYNHPGTVITASAGDSGYGVEYPAASPYVTAVGGTSLSQDSSSSRGWDESVWSTSSSEGTGSGCSAYESQPSWQTSELSSLSLTGCGNRVVADVSAVADPATGVAVYDTDLSNGGWNVYGGTSAASPLIAAVYALAGAPGSSDNPAAYPYNDTSALNNVTSGSNGSCSPTWLCTGGTGYNGPTGLGTPNGTAAFSASK
jgi:subtilase family serine protease